MRRLIRASAGSGKTYRLSGHFLRQLFLGQPAETILATTFTRKAAGEILGRVLLRLADAADDPKACRVLAESLSLPEVTPETALELLTRVTGQLHRMRVCTLDSFFQLMARTLTLELGLPPGWTIIDEHVESDLRQQAIDAVLAQHVAGDAQQLMQMLAKGRSKRSVRELIDATVANFYELFLLTDKDAWHRFPNHRRLTNEERERAIQTLMAADLPEDKRAEKARYEDCERFRSGQWEWFVTKGMAKKVFQGELKFYSREMPADLVDAYEPLVAHARAELIDQVARQTRASWELLARFDAEFTRLRSEHGWMRFSDVTRVLARFGHAAESGRLDFRMDTSIRHLLLDEFQDTSPDQWQILKRLALAIPAKREDSSFFCVGDTKQAIYGWRGGVAAILDAVQNTIEGVSPESLDISYRSSSAVISTVNRLFQFVGRHQNLDLYADACLKWCSAFPAHSTVHDDRPGFVQMRTSPDFTSDSTDEPRLAWYQWVADQIGTLHQQSPHAEIGVLTRTNATVARLVHELALRGVPASEEGGTAPVDSPAVLAVMSLLHLASHPGCQISRLHVASSPLADVIGLTDWTDTAQAQSVAASLRARFMDQGYGPTLQWLSEAVRQDCSQRDLVRLQQVVAAGWQFDESPSLNPSDFVRLLENSRFARSAAAPVRVMTIHQSKGLEFEIVVLPELSGNLFRPPSAAAGGPGAGAAPDHVSIWRSRELQSLFPQALQEAFEQTTARELAEALSLLYVAMTRAVHALHLLVPPVTAKKTPRTFAGLLIASLTDDQTAAPETVLYEAGDPAWNSQCVQPSSGSDSRRLFGRVEHIPRVTLAAMPDGRRRGLTRRAPSRHDETRLYLPSATQPTNADRQEVDARTKGTLIHAWFESIEWLSPGARPDPAGLREIALGLAMSETVINTLIPDFFALLDRPWTRAALTRETVVETRAFADLADAIRSGEVTLRVWSERPFVLRRESAIVQGTIDRLVVASRGRQALAAEILDFKTDRLVGDVVAWTAEKQDYYRSQLAEYRKAVEHCFQLSPAAITTRILLLEADVVVEV